MAGRLIQVADRLAKNVVGVTSGCGIATNPCATSGPGQVEHNARIPYSPV